MASTLGEGLLACRQTHFSEPSSELKVKTGRFNDDRLFEDMELGTALLNQDLVFLGPPENEEPKMATTVFITEVHMSGGTRHEHIAEVKWRNNANGESGKSTRAVMVDWIDNKKGEAKVTDGRNTVSVGVVRENPPYLRTHADGKWTDNLLALPRY